MSLPLLPVWKSDTHICNPPNTRIHQYWNTLLPVRTLPHLWLFPESYHNRSPPGFCDVVSSFSSHSVVCVHFHMCYIRPLYHCIAIHIIANVIRRNWCLPVNFRTNWKILCQFPIFQNIIIFTWSQLFRLIVVTDQRLIFFRITDGFIYYDIINQLNVLIVFCCIYLIFVPVICIWSRSKNQFLCSILVNVQQTVSRIRKQPSVIFSSYLFFL